MSRLATVPRARPRDVSPRDIPSRILAAVAHPIIVSDADHCITYANEAAERLFGWTAGDLLGRRIFDEFSLHEAHDWRTQARHRILSGESWTGELLFRHRDGTPIPSLVVASLLVDDHGTTVGIVSSITDLRQRKADEAELRTHEQQLQQLGRIEAIGRLAGGVAHDFNNVLTSLRGTAEILRASLPPDTEWADDAAEIIQAADRAASLTRQLLAFSRQQVLQPRTVDLAVVARGITRMLEPLLGPRVDFTPILPTHCAYARADIGQLEQVIVNLAVNARDAMPQGGDLTLAVFPAAVVAADPHRPAQLPPGDYVELSLSDTGEGMTEDVRARVFEPFFTTKELGRGTGLGLSTVYGIVKQSDGFIFAESKVGAGATFRVFLPAVSGDDVVDVDAAPPEEPPLPVQPGRTLLIVDDEAPICMLLKRAFSTLGYVPTAAASAEEALAIIATDGVPDLVISDLHMPGKDADTFHARLRALAPDLPLVLFSGDGDALIRAEAASWPRVAIAQKPIRLGQLAAAVAGMLEGK